MHPPAVELKIIEPRVNRCSLIEASPVLEKQITLDTKGTMLGRQLLSSPICVRCHDDHRIKMAMVPLQRNREQIIEADRGDYYL